MAHAPQVNDPLIGRVLDGRYEMLERIGEGGMGVVYKARQVSIDRIVAIKMLAPHMAKDPNWVKRFNNEAMACSRLQHPNTIRMFDFGQTSEGRLFMTMEFLDGQSLRQAIATGSPMAPVRVLKILIQCCASLAEAHNLGIIHRDIKPDNVFLLNLAGSPDFVKLLDFSVAKLLQNDAMRTQAGVVFGTPQYMSPEQGRGMPLDARSDLYALGILAYEMLTGRVPFSDENPMNVLQMHMRQPVPALPSEVPPPVRTMVMRTLEKDASRRYQSATEMMQHCQQTFAQLGAQAAGIDLPAQAMAGLGGPPPAAGEGEVPIARRKTAVPGGGYVAPGPPPAAGGAPPGAPPPGAHRRAGTPPPQVASAEQKTVMAEAPLEEIARLRAQMQAGGAPPGAPPPGAPPPSSNAPGPGAAVAPSEQKTVMAEAPLEEIARVRAQMQAGGAPPGASPPGASPAGTPPPSVGTPPGMTPTTPPPGMVPPTTGAAPQKTMILAESEGVVSIAEQGSPPIAPVVEEHTDSTSITTTGGGATPLFWAICLITGLGVGVLAYLAVLAFG